MSDISSQLIKDSYNYVLQSDLSTGNIYRVGGGIPVNPSFLSGLTINSSFKYSNGSEQPGYALITDGFGNATWGPVSGSSSGDYLPLSGGTVTGPTIFTGGLTANTISATTYFNLPSGLTCNDLSGCTIIQNIEQDIIDIQDNYVPYTGATKDVNLSGYSINANSLNFYVDQNNNGSFGGVVSGPSFRKLTFKTLDSGSGFGLVDINVNPEDGINFSIGDSSETSESKIGLNPETTEIKTSTSSYVHTLFLQNGESSLSVDDLGNIESNNISVLGSKTYSRKYIEAPGFEGNYANLNTLTSTTISATTYLNLPVSGVTGGTGISAGTTNGLVTIVNTLPDQVVTITGGTNISVNGTYPNFGINFTGSTGISGDFLPLSGGTVSGATIFTGGLTANTISATTYFNLPVSGLTSGTGIDISNSNGNYTISYTGSSSGGLSYFISASTPTETIMSGDRWFNTDTGVELVWIDDGDSQQWIQPFSVPGPLSPDAGYYTTTGITTGQTLTWDKTYWGISGNSNIDLVLPSVVGKEGYYLIIKDESGICGIYRIRITPSSGTIDNNNYVDMNINYMSLTCMVRDGNWYLI
jgi:hypothetical protein